MGTDGSNTDAGDGRAGRSEGQLPPEPDHRPGAYPVWAVPARWPGWTLLVLDRDGIHQWGHPDGSRLTTSQNRYRPVPGQGDEAASLALADAVVAGLARERSAVEVGRTRDSVRVLDGPGEVDVIRTELVYPGTRTTFRTIVLARSFPTTWAWLTWQYAAPEPVFDRVGAERFRDACAIRYAPAGGF